MRRALPRRPPAALDPRLLRLRGARAQRARQAAASRCREAWYEIPVFYFSNPAAVYRDGDEVPKPADTADARLRARAGRGDRRRGRHRGLHGHERLVGARPPGQGDVGGPRARPRARTSPRRSAPSSCRRTSCPADLDMRAVARVNGEVRTDTRTGAMHWSWDEILAAAARNTPGLQRRRRDRLGHRRRRLHPRARRRPLARAGRRGGARDRGHRRAAQPRRLAAAFTSGAVRKPICSDSATTRGAPHRRRVEDAVRRSPAGARVVGRPRGRAGRGRRWSPCASSTSGTRSELRPPPRRAGPGDLERHERQDRIADARRVDLGPEAGDHPARDQLVEPRLHGSARDAELARDLRQPDTRVRRASSRSGARRAASISLGDMTRVQWPYDRTI